MEHEWHWSTSEEAFIAENAGKMPVSEMSRILGRSESAIAYHAHVMREEGRLHASLRFRPFRSSLSECPECGNMRSSFEGDVCRVCHDEGRFKVHVGAMKAAYDELPMHVKERTNGTFAIEHRNPPRMPMKPDTRDMTVYKAMQAEDRYARAMERWELQMLRLDIDAAKQRASKWRRKAAQERNEKTKVNNA